MAVVRGFTAFTLRRVLGPAIVIAGSVACSSLNNLPSSLAPEQAGVQSVRRAVESPRVHLGLACPAAVVYVVSSQNRSIEIYDSAQLRAGPCGSITGFSSPQGLFVDSKGSLWVADAGGQKIYEFLPRENTPARTLSDPYGVPVAVAIDEAKHVVYVTEYQNNVHSTTLVEEYANGSATPTGSLSDPNARNGAFDAVDNQGNVYVTFMTQSNTAQVDRWIGGAGNPANLGLELVSAGAILTTASGALAACDPFGYRCGEFAPGSKKMSHVFGHLGLGHCGVIVPDKRPFLHPDALALNRSERLGYVAANSVTEWTFPGPAQRPNRRPLLEIKIPGGAGKGIAVNPAAGPGKPYQRVEP